MSEQPFAANLYVVEAAVLPEIFIKVSQAKILIETGAASTVQEATGKVGISRSAYYKYKDAIAPFRSRVRDSIMTVSVNMLDQPGALSRVLSLFAESHANILTINQSIPTNGVAFVTISCTTAQMTTGMEVLKEKIESLPEVVHMTLLAD